jgi:hypothetical protein
MMVEVCQMVVRWLKGVIWCRMLILHCYILLLLTYTLANYVYKNIMLNLTLTDMFEVIKIEFC